MSVQQNHRDPKARWDARYARKDLVWSAAPNALFAEQVTPLQPGSALDIGCGEGRHAIWLAQRGWRVTALDFSSVGIKKGQAMAREAGVDVTWQIADVCAWAWPEAHFDLVAVLFLHTDAESRAVWLPRAVEAVAPGGRFVYIGHDPSNIKHGVGGPQDPQVLPSAEEIVAALPHFDILEARVFERTGKAEPGHRTGSDTGTGTDKVALDTFVSAIRRS